MRARWEHPATDADTCTWRRCLPASHFRETLREADGQPVGLVEATVGHPSTASSSPSPSVSVRAAGLAGAPATAGSPTAGPRVATRRRAAAATRARITSTPAEPTSTARHVRITLIPHITRSA